MFSQLGPSLNSTNTDGVKPLSECRLYAFVDSAYLGSKDPVEVARRLCDGGADLIQLRAKDWSSERILACARNLVPVTRSAGVRLVINDHLNIAREVGAEVCHLGQEDFFDEGHLRCSDLNLLGPRLELGLSTHAPEQAERAMNAGPDYIAIGPIFPTGTKPGRPAVTLDYVRWAAAHVTLPWFAIGGINLQNINQVLEAGARRICVVSAILQSPDITQACRQFRACLD